MRIDWSMRGLRTRMNVQRRRRCTFILSPVLSRRDKTLETRHPPTVDPVMNVQLRPGWQEGSDGWPAAGCPAAGARGGYSASWSLVPLPRSSQAWGWCRGVGPPRRAGAREGGGRRRVRRAVRCGSESLSRGGVEAVLPQGRTVRRHLPGPLPGTVPPGRGVPGPRWPVMSPGGVWLGAATGLPGWGPADRVAHVQDPLLRGPVRAPRSPKAVLFCRPPLLRCRVPGPCRGCGHLLPCGPGRGSVRTWAAPALITVRAGAGVRTTPRIQLGPHPLPRGLGREGRRSLLAIPALTTTRARGAVRGADW